MTVICIWLGERGRGRPVDSGDMIVCVDNTSPQQWLTQSRAMEQFIGANQNKYFND